MSSKKILAEQPELHRNDVLNPDVWDGDSIKRDVRTALLNFAEAWRVFAKIPEDAVVDVILVGGNAGYYYNETSDLDVHLVVDRSRLGLGSLTDEYLRDKKALWTIKHDVRVKGYQVEPYAQDVSEGSPAGQGVYSLQRDQWVKRPVQSDYDPRHDTVLAEKTRRWIESIDKLTSGDHDLDDYEAIKRKLADMRTKSIAAGGELSRGNLIFKNLRMSGHLDRVQDYIRRKTTDSLSLS